MRHVAQSNGRRDLIHRDPKCGAVIWRLDEKTVCGVAMYFVSFFLRPDRPARLWIHLRIGAVRGCFNITLTALLSKVSSHRKYRAWSWWHLAQRPCLLKDVREVGNKRLPVTPVYRRSIFPPYRGNWRNSTLRCPELYDKDFSTIVVTWWWHQQGFGFTWAFIGLRRKFTIERQGILSIRQVANSILYCCLV